MKYIKIYDRSHNILDEIYDINSLNYTHTLNGLGSCNFNISITSAKYTSSNFNIMNCIEVWEGSSILWWGVVAYSIPKGSLINVLCYGYLYVWQKTSAELLSGSNALVSTAISDMISSVNSFSTLAFTSGNTESTLNIVSYNRANEDFYKRLNEVATQYNLDFDISSTRALNYYLRRGTDKEYYSINWGTTADNVTGESSYDVSTSSVANYIVYNDGTNRYVAQDTSSQAAYGMLQAISSVSLTSPSVADIQNAVNAELQRMSQPQVSIQMDIVDTALCPYSDITVGDRVLVNLVPYNFSQMMKIIELSFDVITGKCHVTMGNVIYRPSKLQKKIYVR